MFLKILKSLGLILVVVFIILFIARDFHYFDVQKTKIQVEKIHNTKLTLDDVMGKNLPPDPGVEADKTIAGIDVNNNGIRDDVELAIFKEYPNSAKTRAVLLQYALALQMEANQPFVNKEIVIATIQEEDRAYSCFGKILDNSMKNVYFSNWDSLVLFIKQKQLNTILRQNFRQKFYNNIGSYSSINRFCDINYSTLLN